MLPRQEVQYPEMPLCPFSDNQPVCTAKIKVHPIEVGSERALTPSHADDAGCSYFASRALAAEASIVFCPYNYIIDPGEPYWTPFIQMRWEELCCLFWTLNASLWCFQYHKSCLFCNGNRCRSQTHLFVRTKSCLPLHAVIRKAMEMDIKNSIIILDEAQ